MPQVLVRGIEAVVVERLKDRAKQNGRSLEAELRLILNQASNDSVAQMQAEVARVRAMFVGRQLSDSTEFLREDRDR